MRFSSCSYDMEGHAKTCAEGYCELANKTTQQLYKLSIPCIDDHHFKKEELKSVGELSQECSQIVLKMHTFGTYWTWYSVVSEQSCKIDYEMDQSMWQTVISFDLLHSSSEYKQYCREGNIAKQCRLGLFQDSDFAGDLEDSKSTSGGTLCISGSHTFVPFRWMCQKQTSVSHSSTESEIISLDAGFRMDGAPALDLWDLILAVHGNTCRSHQGRGDLSTNLVRSTPHTIQKRKKSHGMIDDLNNVDFISSNVHSSRQKALLYIFEDNDAVIKMIIKERSYTIRHVSRTHRVALDWLSDKINLDPKKPHQVHRHQKPTRRHTDQGKYHTWWMESSFVFVQH